MASEDGAGFAFWGCVVNPGKAVKVQVSDHALNVTAACIGPAGGEGRVWVSIQEEDEPEGKLIACLSDAQAHISLNLVLQEGVAFRFRVQGSRPVHLSGYLQPIAMPYGMDEMDFDSEDDEEIESEEEEAPALIEAPQEAGSKVTVPTPVQTIEPAKKRKQEQPQEEEKPSKKNKNEEEKGTEGFTKLGEGLLIKDLEQGVGKVAKKGMKCLMRYRGMLKNGKEFDSNMDAKKPFAFKLGQGQVIKGWDMGVVGMKEGGKRLLVVPAKLGYGRAGSPPVIPPNATLVFEVTLAKVH